MKWGESVIPAERYNQVRLGLLRLKNPLCIDTGLRDIDLILEDKVWYCVDRSMHDLPVVAWDQFQPRTALHEPVACRLSYYHAHADKIVDAIFKILDDYLEKQLTLLRQNFE
jgi:hypothetical protein